MKKFVLSLTFIILTTTSYSQVSTVPMQAPDSIASSKKDYYLKKSHSQQKIGNAFLLGGSVLLGSGVLVLFRELLSYSSSGDASELLISSGFISSTVGGVYLLSASRNRKKAVAATLGQTQYLHPLQGVLHTQRTPTAGLKIIF